ncbi:MAG: hypothetical protein AAF346_20765, partial [Pseudomonadota bacterium]
TETAKTKQDPTKDSTRAAAKDSECKSDQRPIIETVDKLPADLVEMGELKPSADRPCAAIAKLTYKD